MKVLSILFSIVALSSAIALAPSGALAKTNMPRYTDEEMNEFFDNPTVGVYQRIPEDARLHFLADMLVLGDEMSQVQNDFLNYQLPQLSAEDRVSTYQKAFAQALSGKNSDLAFNFFNYATAISPSSASKVICDSLKEMGAFYLITGMLTRPRQEEGAQSVIDKLGVMMPIIASQPGLVDRSCTYLDGRKTYNISIRRAITYNSDVLATQLPPPTIPQQPIVFPRAELVQDNSTCTARKVRTDFTPAVISLHQGVQPSVVISNDGNCRINAWLWKERDGSTGLILNRNVPGAYRASAIIKRNVDHVVATIHSGVPGTAGVKEYFTLSDAAPAKAGASKMEPNPVADELSVIVSIFMRTQR